MFKKYWTIFSNDLSSEINFRTEMIIWIILDTLPTLIFFIIWQKVYSQNPVVDGYTYSQIVEFYFFTLIINNISSAHFEQYHVKQIREGKIDLFLTRPLPYPESVFWTHLAGKLVYMSLLIPAYTLLVFVCLHLFQISFSSISVWQAVQFLFLLLFATTVEFLVGLIIVTLGFWFEGAEGLEHFKWLVISLFAGALMPLTFLPKWLQQITQALPFQFMYAKPIAIIQLHQSIQLSEIAYMLGFLILLITCENILWKKAMFKYTSAGG